MEFGISYWLKRSKQAVGGRPPRYASSPCKLTISSYLFVRWHLFWDVDYLIHQQQVDLWPFDLETGVTWATFVPILVFLGLSVLELGPMYAVRYRQTSDRRQTKASLNASALWGRRYNNVKIGKDLSELLSKVRCHVLMNHDVRWSTVYNWCSYYQSQLLANYPHVVSWQISNVVPT